MHKLLVPANIRIGAVAIVAFGVSAPYLPPGAVALCVACMLSLFVIGQNLSRWRRPEVALMYTTAAIEIAIAAAMVLGHVALKGTLTMVLWPLVSFNARYPKRAAVVGTVFTTLLAVAAAVIGDPRALVHDPLGLALPLVVIIAVAVVTSAARESDIAHARQAVIDPLTGLLNRAALQSRVRELSSQTVSAVADASIAVLLGDIDHFKSINDQYGHQAGDDVLKAVAIRLRGELRAFDLLYRLGGEEFLVLAPGATGQEGQELAERLRSAVASEPLAGLPVTMSWGVSSGRHGFVWSELYHEADIALYEAKAGGRNQVIARPCPGSEAVLA